MRASLIVVIKVVITIKIRRIIVTITKVDLVKRIEEKTGLRRTECINIVESFFTIMKDELAAGNPVKISGFGKWIVRSKRPRNGRNPYTGKAMTLRARKVVTFKTSGVMRKSLKQEG